MFNLFKTPQIIEIINDFNINDPQYSIKNFIKYLKNEKKTDYPKILEFIQNASKTISDEQKKKIFTYLIKKFELDTKEDKYYIINSIFELNPNLLTDSKIKNKIFNNLNIDILEKIYIGNESKIVKNKELVNLFWNIFLYNSKPRFILKYLNKNIIEENPQLFLDYFKSLKLHNKTKNEIFEKLYEKHKKSFMKYYNEYKNFSRYKNNCSLNQTEDIFTHLYETELNENWKFLGQYYFDLKLNFKRNNKNFDPTCFEKIKYIFIKHLSYSNLYDCDYLNDIKNVLQEPIKYNYFMILFYLKKLKNTSLDKEFSKILKEQIDSIPIKKLNYYSQITGEEYNLYATLKFVKFIYKIDNQSKILIESLINKLDHNLLIIFDTDGWVNITFGPHTELFIRLFNYFYSKIKGNYLPSYYIIYLAKNKSLSNNIKNEIKNYINYLIINNKSKQITDLIETLIEKFPYSEKFIDFFEILDDKLFNDLFLFFLTNFSLDQTLFLFEKYANFNKIPHLLSRLDNNFHIKLLKKENEINIQNIYRILYIYFISEINNYFKEYTENFIIYENTLKQFTIDKNIEKPKKYITFINMLIKEKQYNLALYSILNNNEIFITDKYLQTIVQKILEIIKEIDFNINEIYFYFENYFYLMDLYILEKLAALFLNKKDIEKTKKIISIIKQIDNTNPFIKKADNLIQKYENISKLMNQEIDYNEINSLSGTEFEELIATKFNNLGFKAYITPKSRDYGADIIVECKDKKIAIQCKRFKNKVNLKAVQEIGSALSYYNADYGIVITNNEFLDSAINLAKSNNIELWDNLNLLKFLNNDLSFSYIFNSYKNKNS